MEMGRVGKVSWVVGGILGLALAGCNSGGGSSSTVAGVGLEMPTEVSAVPASGSGSSKMVAAMMALGAAADAGTDYSNAQTVRWVNEPTIEQFEIISEILDALAQTHYADAENIGAGAYKAMIAFQDDKNGVATKSLEPWIVQSDLITESGATVQRVRFWIEENMGGQTRTIKCEVKIYEAATQNTDGSYADYGVWTINAKMNDAGTNFFAASADRGSSGETILQLHELMDEGSFTHEVKAYLNKSDTTGHGKVQYPDWSGCASWPCTPSATTAAYAYNGTHLAVQKGSDPVQYKDRTAVTSLTNRYGLFDSVTGDDALKTKSFGFPVRFTDTNGTHFAYYGAWQGRHQLWSGEGSVPDGTTVTREDHGANQTAAQYTTASFSGTLTKRTMVTADISDVLNLPFEIWINQNAGLVYRTTGTPSWRENVCQPPPGGCTESSTAFDLNKLIVESNNNRKFVNIGGFNLTGLPAGMAQLVYDPAGNVSPNLSGPGFYQTSGSPPNLTSTGTRYTPADGDQVWVNIGGSTYIEYQGAGGWVEKELVNFNQQTWTPEFGTNDRSFTLDLDREYYINNQGANYVVKRTGASTYEVMIELQSVANPVNYATMLSGVHHFRAQWGDNTFTFDTTSSSPTFLKLVYVSGTDSQGSAVTVGDVVADGQWGIVAQDASNADILSGGRPVQFNWDYPRTGETWGIMTYLVDANSTYHLLDDPISLAPVTLTNGANVSKTLSLRYDGWMHGLPDLFNELQKNDFVVTTDIANKIIDIPAGTSVTDATDSTISYLVKPLEVSEFLTVVSDPGTLGTAMTTAGAVDLSTVPDFVDHSMGAMPSVTVPKYSEGVLIE